MDTTAPEISFDENGRCNFCWAAEAEWQKLPSSPSESIRDPEADYDCLIGLSGGVDSSYLLKWAKDWGLRVLTFSVDNGWNDPKADENIMRLVEGMKVPFMRYTIDLEEFKQLQAAFMRAGVKNIEIPTDHVLMAVSYELAARYGIKTILSGGNVATESIMPASWGHNARDLTHIKDIYKKMTGRRLKRLPLCSVWKWNWYRWVKGINVAYPLDWVRYDRNKAVKVLEDKFGYQPYGEKHCESIFTAWFQNFYLYEKWGIDKRKAHLSSLIVSRQMTRAEAMAELEKNPVYPQLGIEQKVLQYPKHEHAEYRMDPWYNRIAWLIRSSKTLCKS